ncbi:ABC transporter ATP-binding protein/permease [Spiroplasma sabaudiense Ar-1343]|uniref:ABC transporter ATP-binding protein/permease n=1 Tax=Spiroplasma sabaudiense Ar-1343 TaxID=1276257 RepID=W6AIN7_9MOLU|nr:ABC transporter ATP-binding protein [Spiroplasma sabaudiense]AHI53569.1 ABC transporter ATP-binding protein/permease [Spiroplasma sabaudiense Ar-1343]
MAKFVNDKAFSYQKFKGFLKPIFASVKKSPWLFSFIVLSVAMDAIAFSFIPKFLQLMIEKVLLSARESAQPGTVDLSQNLFGHIITVDWTVWLWVILGIFLFMVACEYFGNYTSSLFAKRIEIDLRIECLERLVKQDISYYYDHQLGLIMSRVIGDTEGVGLGLNDFILNAVYLVAMYVTTSALMLTMDIPIALIAISYTMLVFIATWIIFIYYRRAILVSVDIRQKIDTEITDRLMNVRLIKSSGTEEYETQRSIENHEPYNKAANRVIKLQTTLQMFNGFAVAILSSLMVISAFLLYHSDPDKVINLIVGFTTSIFALAAPIAYATMTFRGATKAANCAMRLSDILQPIPLIIPDPQGIKIAKIDEIKFENLGFAYPSKPENQILPNIDFTFEKNKSYAFVGETGVGKSTFAQLLLRFYDPTTGRITINGIDLKELDLPDYLSKVGYVEQDPQILYGDIYYNVGYGIENVTNAQIEEACKKAQLHNYVETLPEKYHTILGEHGLMFSGGQKQRLVIARLFLKDPQLLILDEATSALDNIVEHEIQEELEKLMKNRTSVTIAHKLSTIRNVDQIIVLDKVKGIAQVGTFEDLKTTQGRFRKLYLAGLME